MYHFEIISRFLLIKKYSMIFILGIREEALDYRFVFARHFSTSLSYPDVAVELVAHFQYQLTSRQSN